ncbi:MAG: hypothetical protein WAN76_20450, partial [Candidatus Sulfotelmatobacter sp.]
PVAEGKQKCSVQALLSARLAIAMALVTGWLAAGWLGLCWPCSKGGGALGRAGSDRTASPASGFAQKRQNFRPSLFS